MKLTIKAVGAALVAGMVLLAGCAHPLMGKQAAGDGRGNVTVRIGSAARTLRPDVAGITGYDVAFAGPEGASEATTIAKGETAATVSLVPGAWTVTVTAYAGEGEAQVTVAVGSAPVTVEADKMDTAVTVVLFPYDGADAAKGTLSYTIAFPEGLTAATGSLVAVGTDGTETAVGAVGAEVDLLEGENNPGTLELDSGSYLLRIRLAKGEQTAGKTEALHIYPGLTTTAAYTFADADFADNGNGNNNNNEADPNDGQTVDGWIIIASVETFAKIGNDADFPLDGQYKQTADITITNNHHWTPIGTANKEFKGTFDGGDKTITADNLTFSSAFSFFGETNGATLKNIHIEGSITTTNGALGGIATVATSTTFDKCSNAANLTSPEGVGGICYTLYSGSSITNCWNTGDITGNGPGTDMVNFHMFVGGISGVVFEKNLVNEKSSIEACYNTGTIRAECVNNIKAGGIVGEVTYGEKIIACYNTGDVSASGVLVDEYNIAGIGGIIGMLNDTAVSITACYSVGSVSNTCTVGIVSAGGIIGFVSASEDSTTTSYIVPTACYWTSGSTATHGIGGLYDWDTYLFATNSATNDGAAEFTNNKPAEGETGWGIGNDPASGNYWKSLGDGSASYPKLWFEE